MEWILLFVDVRNRHLRIMKGDEIKGSGLETSGNGAIVEQTRKLLRLVAIGQADILAAWIMITMVNISFHHLIPLDETRYATVAWEMLYRHDFLVPYLNGEPYHHKPPLLFWLYDLGWSAFGVGEIWPLLVSPICGLASLYLTRYLARLLWPGDKKLARLAPWVLFGSLLWGAFLNSAMFDTLLTACVLLAMCGLIKASHDFNWRSWSLFALGCGLGLLAKGPVIFVHTLVPFLTGCVWSETVRSLFKRWYLCGFTAVMLAIALALAWAVPAIVSAGDEYGVTLLWHQTVDRINNSFAHKRPLWWYLMLSPILLFPWFFWPRAWRNLFDRNLLNDCSFLFCAIWFGAGFIAFSLISGKQAHYLLPLLPALALLLSKAIAGDVTTARPSDYLPFVFVCIFGLLLLILPQVNGATLYHWLQRRELWWAVLILLTGSGAMVVIAKSGVISPYLLPLTVLLEVSISLAGFFSSTGNAFQLRQAAQELDVFRKAGEPIAWAGKYDGQFQFLLRLTEPMAIIDKSAVDSWLVYHRNGHVISIQEGDEAEVQAYCNDYWQYYREDKLCIHSSPREAQHV